MDSSRRRQHSSEFLFQGFRAFSFVAFVLFETMDQSLLAIEDQPHFAFKRSILRHGEGRAALSQSGSHVRLRSIDELSLFFSVLSQAARGCASPVQKPKRTVAGSRI